MSDTIWGERKPGSPVAVGGDEQGGHVIIADVPDWVRTPPELGGEKLKVSRAYLRDCPCQGGHKVKTLDFEGSPLHVSECVARGFMWWKERA